MPTAAPVGMTPEFDFAAQRVDELIEELLRMRRVGLLGEIQPHVTAVDLQNGYLMRATRTALLDAIRWAQRREEDGKTAPPPPDWTGDAITPLVEHIPELDWSECDTSPGTPKALRRDAARVQTRPTRTVPSMVPPPPKLPPPLPPKRR